MDRFLPFLDKVENPAQRERLSGILRWVLEEFPQLETRIAWNQPMFTDHGTFILGFSVAKGHLAVAPEGKGIQVFEEELKQRGYAPSSMIFRIRWDQNVDYELLRRIIAYNIEDKQGCRTFWRKQP